jgi:hypothetical protein
MRTRSRPGPFGLVAAIILVAAALAGGAGAAEPVPPAEVAQLRQQIAQLRQILEHLDERLQHLEQTPAPSAAAGVPSEPAAATTQPPPPPISPTALAYAGTGVATMDAHEQAVLRDQVRTADALTAWHEVRAGMGKEDVRRLLGNPQSTLTVGNRTGWIYSYRNAGKGSVFFDNDGVVVSLMNPGQGPLHMY